MPTAMMESYNLFAQSSAGRRRADPRIVSRLLDFLPRPNGEYIADIGAGAGHYANALADRGFLVRAVEPSSIMRYQAQEHTNVNWFVGNAERIPFARASVRAAVSIQSVHRYRDAQASFREMDRIAGSGPLVIFTFDYRLMRRPWLADYFPNLWRKAVESTPPLDDRVAEIVNATARSVEVVPYPLPADLSDMFLLAAWRRPQLYLLDPQVRAGILSFAIDHEDEMQVGLSRLDADLQSGRWYATNAGIVELEELDLGYRFLVARRQSRR
jgi:SAM-dependent methyltransferase